MNPKEIANQLEVIWHMAIVDFRFDLTFLFGFVEKGEGPQAGMSNRATTRAQQFLEILDLFEAKVGHTRGQRFCTPCMTRNLSTNA